MAYAHIGHDCQIGDDVILANCATLAGHVVLEDQVVFGGLSGIHQFCRVGQMAIVGGCTKLTQDVPPFMMADGNPVAIRGTNRVGLKRRGVSAEVRKMLKETYRILYRENLTTSVAVERKCSIRPCKASTTASTITSLRASVRVFVKPISTTWSTKRGLIG